MRRTSANEARRRVASKAGFTLLEMILVIAIFSLAISLVLPAASDQMSRADRVAAVTEFRVEMARLRAEAHFRQTEIVVLGLGEGRRTSGVSSIQLTGGWRAVAPSVLRIDETGRCNTDQIELKKAGRAPVQLNRIGPACNFAPR